ncbi:N-acetyltransferase family protein [Thermovibrio ammonificans]
MASRRSSKTLLPVRIERWNFMKNFDSFYPMFRRFLADIYGSAERGLSIYQSRYRAVDYYRNYRVRPNSYLLVATVGREPVGWLYARRKKDHTYIYDIFVKPEFRKRGVGRALVDEVEKLAGGPLVAETHEGAVEALKSWGFTVEGGYEEDGIKWFVVKRAS